jgi:hypothetical protein
MPDEAYVTTGSIFYGYNDIVHAVDVTFTAKKYNTTVQETKFVPLIFDTNNTITNYINLTPMQVNEWVSTMLDTLNHYPVTTTTNILISSTDTVSGTTTYVSTSTSTSISYIENLEIQLEQKLDADYQELLVTLPPWKLNYTSTST